MPGLLGDPSQGGGGLLSNFFGSLQAGLAPQGYQAQLQQQALQAQYQAYQQAGVPEPLAKIFALNPDAAKQYGGAYLDQAPKIAESGTDPLSGQKSFVIQRQGMNPSVTAAPIQAPGGGGTAQPQQQTLQGILDSIAQGRAANEPREQTLQRVPIQYRSPVKAMLEGQSVPTNFSMRGQVRDAALNIAHAIDDNFNELEIPGRRKMFTDLNSSGQGSMGGILSNGKSAMGHLADLGDKFVDMNPTNGPDIPGGGHIANVENYVGNTLFPTAATKGKISATKDNLLKYGEESTKFYSATGGGEGERTYALKNLNPNTVSGAEAAGYLETERGLMDRRMAEKEAQVRNSLGQSYLDKHPIRDAEYQKTLARIDANIAKLKSGATPQAQPQQSTLPGGFKYLGSRAQ